VVKKYKKNVMLSMTALVSVVKVGMFVLKILHIRTYRLKVKVKLSLCLTKHHAMKTYWGVEV
jgi:hypothetical protein